MDRLLEETGIEVALEGLAWVEFDGGSDTVIMGLRARPVGGALTTSDETQDVDWVDYDRMADYITRPHLLTRAQGVSQG